MKKTATFLIVLSLIFSCGSGKARENAETAVPETPKAPAPLHDSFSFTAEDLPILMEGLPDGVRHKINEQPQRFLQLMLEVLEEDPLLTRLVNKEIGLSQDDAPEDIVELDDYRDSLILSRPGHRLSARALPALQAMTGAAEKEGLKLMVSSAYRPYDYQKMLFERYAARDGVEAAERYSARPGKSQHQLGTAMDFGSIDDSFAESAEGKWMKENAGSFGFSLSYPKGYEEYTGYIWESWHYRYTGIPCCSLEKEFFQGIQERTLRYVHEKSSLFRAALIKENKNR